MIDQQLIDQNISSLTSAAHNGHTVDNCLRLVTNVFGQALISKLNQYFDHNYHSDLWQPETDTYGVPMDKTPRYKLAWDAESVIEETHEICQGLTPVLAELYLEAPKKFEGITIWRDHPGYDLAWHTDNPVISASLQVYISGSERNPGTEFKTGNSSMIVPFVPNTGYICHRTGLNPVHRVAHPVPAGEVRYSLFAIWKDVL
jgi:hypothetical protein